MNAAPTLPAADPARLEALERAFAQFTETSRQLESSWAALTARVAELTRERDAADAARLRELAERERVADRLQVLLAALPGAALMLDGDGLVRECNRGAEELLGLPLAGEPWQRVAARALKAVADADGTPRLADGRRLGVLRRATADGGSVLLLTDESEAHARRRGVEQQRRLADLDQQHARLAHQLRTPLATAVLYLSRIAEGGLDKTDVARMADRSLARLRDLQQLIDETLALARGDAGVDETLGVDELLAALDATFADPAERTRLAIMPGAAPCWLRGQRNLLLSALVGLVENALAFAPRVELEVHADDDAVRIAVRDDGPGIAAEVAERVFEPFFTTRRNGTGLGLALARTVAQAHGGTLRLVPAPRGACFELVLPHAEQGPQLPSDFHTDAARAGADRTLAENEDA